MAASSNLYANSIFSEHPIALYSLDDDVKYISLISDTQRRFVAGSWSASANNSASVSFSDSPTLPILPSPFDSNIYSQVSASVISNNTTIEIKSAELFSFNELNQELTTFAISCFLYQSSSHVNWYEIGYSYYDIVTSQNINVVNRVEAEEGNAWINFDFSFLPEEYDANKLKIIIRINLDAGGPPEDYRFIVNGLCIGQWSEAFSTSSLGSRPIQNSLGYKSVPAYEYGIQENSGYYIIEKNKLLAKNDGMPLVYGSTSCTQLYPSTNEDMPSIIFPSRGFLSNSGKNSEYTLEFWINVKPTSSEDKKIFGTIDTNHGIYINNAFISIKVGEKFLSYPVSEWYRPMLIHFSLSRTSASLMINGEVVINLAIDSTDRDLFSSQDWIAFYTYSDIEHFSLECISLYSYIIPTQVATRRFVYGQGTPSPEIVAEAFDGKTMYVNYSNANYNVNKIYPDTANWEGGNSENLKVKKSSISFPEYSLPEIYIGGRNVNDLYADNKIVNDLEGDIFFTFRPHVSNNEFVTEGTKWTEPGYIYFNSLGIIDSLAAIYGVFSTKNIGQTSTLALITKSDSTDNLHIYLDNGMIHYSFNNEIIYSEKIGSPYFDYYDYYNYNNNYSYGPEYFYDYVYNQSEYETRFGYDYYFGYYYFDTVDSEYSFAFGLKIKDFINNYGYLVKRFFESPNNLQVYFGGNKINTFDGKIHSIGLCNSTNILEIPELFNDDGIVDVTEYEDFTNHFATYTLKPLIRFNQFLLDISVSSLWEEYFPLSTFTKYIKNYEGKDKYYDVDYFQINLGYPSAYEVIEKIVTLFNWTYIQLFEEYNYPAQQNYSILNNENISGYETYEDLKVKRELDKFLNTDESSLRSYITFQLLSEGANEPLSSFPYTRELVESKYIDVDLQSDPNNKIRPYLTKFEFVDNTIVFPPRYFDIQDIAIVFHFVLKHEGILSNPLFVRDFEVVSRVLEHNDFNALGSESGLPFYSYIKTGIYYENKTKNPMTIAKKRVPYLYVTENSGLKLLGKQTSQKEHGIAIPINQEKAKDYNIKAMQTWIKLDKRELSLIEKPIFEIQSLNKNIEFIIKSEPSGKRGMITARDKNTRILESGIIFYQNGTRVKTPVIEYDQWNSLGVSFYDELSFSEYSGYINLFREASFNNVSYYKTSGLGRSFELIKRPWKRVLTDDDITNRNWASWYLKDNAATTTRTNIANNPSFESNLNNWDPNGTGTTITRISTDAKYGTYCLKCTTGSGNNSGVLFANTSGQRMSITPETEYTISAYVKIPAGSPSKTLRLRIREYEQVTGGAALPERSQIPLTFSSSDDWVRFSYTFVSDEDANALGIEINQETGNQAGDIFYVDALLIENTTSLSPKVNRYFDGGFIAPGNIFKSVVWNGAANNSSSTAVVYVVQDESIRQWVDVYSVGESIIFALTPQDVYKSYIGKNGFVVDGDTLLTIDADSMYTISDTRWLRFSDIPA